MQQVEPFSKDEESAHEHKNWPRGVHWSGDGEWQVLDGIVAHHPRRQHDERLDCDECVAGKVATEAKRAIGNRRSPHRRHEQRAEQSVEKQHREHVVAIKRKFFEYVVNAQAERRCNCENYPHDKPKTIVINEF